MAQPAHGASTSPGPLSWDKPSMGTGDRHALSPVRIPLRSPTLLLAFRSKRRGGARDRPDHGGKFRLLHRLLAQVARLMEINDLRVATRAVVEAARESLVIGAR